jgi:hypothetical protein
MDFYSVFHTPAIYPVDPVTMPRFLDAKKTKKSLRSRREDVTVSFSRQPASLR